MSDPTLTISIDRTSLALPALVLSGNQDGTDLGVSSYTPPAVQSRLVYAPDSAHIHGSEAIGWSLQDTVIGFSYFAAATTEAEVQAALAELAAAVTQWSYSVTTQVSGAPAQVWKAKPGSVVPPDRNFNNLMNRNPVFSVTIPVHPIPGSA